MDRLRDLGYVVESTRGPGGGYRLRPGANMAPLLLEEEDAIAIAVALTGAATSPVIGVGERAVQALVKLEQVLPSHLRERVRTLQAAITAEPAGAALIDAGSLTAMAEAIRDRERIGFVYRDRAGNESRREVEPHALVSRGRRWYLVAWDRDRRDWRTFRLDRAERVAGRRTSFEARQLPEDPADFVAAHIGAGGRYEARVTLDVPAHEIAERARWLWGSVEPIDERTSEFRTTDDDLDWLTQRIAMLGVDFEIRSPPELIAHMSGVAERLARGVGASMVAPASRGR